MSKGQVQHTALSWDTSDYILSKSNLKRDFPPHCYKTDHIWEASSEGMCVTDKFICYHYPEWQENDKQIEIITFFITSDSVV